jgi:molecular chaperone GrpE
MKQKKHDDVEAEKDAQEIDTAQEESAQEAIPGKVKEKTSEELAQEYLNDLQRLQADFANYKKRQQESQKELSGYLIERLVLDLVPVLDNFRMATNHVPEVSKSDPWVTGIQYIEKQLEDVLTANGLQVIEVNEGDVFDPSIHEAISDEQETENDEGKKTDKEIPAQVVAKVLQKGYKIGGKVIRPAKVSVK